MPSTLADHAPSESTREVLRDALSPHVRLKTWNEYHPYGSTVACQPMAEAIIDRSTIDVALCLEDEYIPTAVGLIVNEVDVYLTLLTATKQGGDWRCRFKVELSG